MRLFLGLVFLVLSQSLVAQWNYEVAPVSGLNTTDNDLVCGRYNDGILFQSNGNTKSKSGRSWNDGHSQKLYTAQINGSFDQFQSIEPLLKFKGSRDEGTASYNPQDSTLYFSTSNDILGLKSGFIMRIYSMKWNGFDWESPILLPFCVDNYTYTQPWFDTDRNLLVFSSNRNGGQGGMDIWFAYKTKEGWTQPANCGGQVNTSSSEINPSVYNGDIYFASNGWLPDMGFELFKSEEKNQWMNAIQLESPLNSDGDDLMIVFLQDDRGLISSRRDRGLGGADVYVFDKVIKRTHGNTFSGLIECKGLGLPKATVQIFNEAGELYDTQTASNQGVIDLRNLVFEEKYKVRLVGINSMLFEHCVLYLLDESGNRVRQWSFNAKGEIELELLRFIYSEIPELKNEDNSVLNLTLSGKLQSTRGISSFSRVPVTIVDDLGEVVAVAYTEQTGEFTFRNVVPEKEYVFRLAPSCKADQMVMFDNGRTVVLPILVQEVYYQRVKDEDALELTNETGDKVIISMNDVFIINRVYYDWNSANLSEISKAQLDQLLVIMKMNDDVNLELTSHTDSRGTAEYNLNLSQRRANAVIDYLSKNGVRKKRLSAEGRGEIDPLNPCDSDDSCSENDHAINRRTEIKFSRPALSYQEH
jgi:outer membrane protein OmpA-like peptidoglycan-associated protein